MFAHAASADEFEGSEYVLEADWHLRPMVSVEEGNKTAISSRRAEQHGRPCFFQADATVPPAPERKWQIVALTRVALEAGGFTLSGWELGRGVEQ